MRARLAWPGGLRVTFRTLLDNWEQKGTPVLTASEYPVRLPLEDAARLHALADMYPGHSCEAILTDLLSVALRELEAAMPYVRGAKVISHDDQGDPVYEDAGPTPRFIELTRKHRKRLAAGARG
jgi:hypothetical protein